MTAMQNEQTPAAGPLTSESVKLLQPGDWLLVLRLCEDGPEAGSLVRLARTDGPRVWIVGDEDSWWFDRFTFLGRPDQDSWIAWHGGENPVPGVPIDLKFDDGSTLRAQSGDDFGMFDIIAYRPHVPSPASSSSVVQGEAGGVERGPITHEVKCWPGPFDARAAGLKPWELRANDRDYRVGDTLRQRRFDPESQQFTGEVDERPITWALYGPAFGLPAGQVIMTLGEDALRPQPSGFLATLTDERRTASLSHTGGDPHPQPSGETREASSDQPEQGGGMEVVAWRYRTAPHRWWHFLTDAEQAKFEREDGIEIQALTPAEPAEARIRSLEAANNLLSGKLERRTASVDAAEARVQELEREVVRLGDALRQASVNLDAAEAKLARAVEGLARVRDYKWPVIVGHDVRVTVGQATGDVYENKFPVARETALSAFRHSKQIARQTLAALQQEGE